MMIQISNPLPQSTGAENAGAVSSGLGSEGVNDGGFNSDLAQQLALLQGNLANEANKGDASLLAAMQTSAVETKGGNPAAEAGMQNFAALFGKALPSAKKIDPSINLDDTMNALSDVLQHLQALESGTENGARILPISGLADPVDKNAPTFSDPVAFVAQPPGDQPVTLGVESAGTAQNPDLNASGSEMQHPILTEASTDQAQAFVGKTASNQKQPQIADKADLSSPDSIAQAIQQILQQPYAENVVVQPAASGEQSAVLKKTDAPAMAEIKRGVGVTLTQAGEDKQASLAMASGLADAMFKQDSDAQHAGQEKQAGLKTAEDDLAMAAAQSKASETDKAPSRLLSDIAQLNQAVGSDKTVEVPAMTRNLAHPEWNTELGEKLLWMHKQAIPSAELRLNPQHLGPILIKVDVDQDQATVNFTTQHAGVKEAIEAAIPRLKEMLGGQQLNLADVNVSQQQSEQRQPREFFQANNGQNQSKNSGQGEDAELAAKPGDIAEEIEAGRAIAGNGLLSLFA